MVQEELHYSTSGGSSWQIIIWVVVIPPPVIVRIAGSLIALLPKITLVILLKKGLA